MSCLHVENMSKSFGKDKILDQISFQVNKNEAVGLLGANGAGKSTLIKCILGLIRTDSGTVQTDQTPAYLAELVQLPPSLSALDLLVYKCRSSHLPISTAQDSLNEFHLDPKAHRKPIRNYSKGMRQRTSLAMTLCNQPQLILLDEPMSGLDALGRAETLTTLKSRKQHGASILMSSHIVSDMVQLCDRVLIMAHGKICEQIEIHEHSLDEVALLEQKLKTWTESIA